jgi:hypothetical protein
VGPICLPRFCGSFQIAWETHRAGDTGLIAGTKAAGSQKRCYDERNEIAEISQITSRFCKQFAVIEITGIASGITILAGWLFAKAGYYSVTNEGYVNVGRSIFVMPKPDRSREVKGFIRRENSQGVPESMCGVCLHTILAPSTESLEILERSHRCRETQESQKLSRQIRFANWHTNR